jgi:hypothetical protein
MTPGSQNSCHRKTSITRQRLGKHIPMVMDTRKTIPELLDAASYRRSVPIPEFILLETVTKRRLVIRQIMYLCAIVICKVWASVKLLERICSHVSQASYTLNVQKRFLVPLLRRNDRAGNELKWYKFCDEVTCNTNT